MTKRLSGSELCNSRGMCGEEILLESAASYSSEP